MLLLLYFYSPLTLAYLSIYVNFPSPTNNVMIKNTAAILRCFKENKMHFFVVLKLPEILTEEILQEIEEDMSKIT